MIKAMVANTTASELSERLVTIISRNDVDTVKSLFNEINRIEKLEDTTINIRWALSSGIYNAVKNNNKEMVELLLKHDASPYGIITDGKSTLIAAVKNNNKELVDLLLKASVDPSGVDVHEGGLSDELTRRTALMFATINGYNEIVSILLDAGADSNLVNKEGLTALHFAVDNGFTDTVKLLLEKSKAIDVNSQDRLGNTALIKAVEACNKDVVKLLLDAGANRELANIQGNTPLTIADRKDCKEISDLLRD